MQLQSTKINIFSHKMTSNDLSYTIFTQQTMYPSYLSETRDYIFWDFKLLVKIGFKNWRKINFGDSKGKFKEPGKHKKHLNIIKSNSCIQTNKQKL